MTARVFSSGVVSAREDKIRILTAAMQSSVHYMDINVTSKSKTPQFSIHFKSTKNSSHLNWLRWGLVILVMLVYQETKPCGA